MPIRRYLGEGVFSSEALSVMGKAFEAAIWTLDPNATKRDVRQLLDYYPDGAE